MYKRDVTRMQSFMDIPEDSIKRITSKALILCGDRDVVLPEHAVEMSRAIPKARLAILPGGHGDYMGEISAPIDTGKIVATAKVIIHFLNDTEPN